MSTYQELSKTFAESVQLQAKYVSDCCAFSNFFFSQMAEYLEWPKDQMAFAHDESLQTEGPMCNRNSARLRDDGNIHFFALFTINRFDNENHRYQLIFPFKVKKLEDSVDRKFKSPFAPAGVGASAPSAGRHGAREAVGED